MRKAPDRESVWVQAAGGAQDPARGGSAGREGTARPVVPSSAIGATERLAGDSAPALNTERHKFTTMRAGASTLRSRRTSEDASGRRASGRDPSRSGEGGQLAELAEVCVRTRPVPGRQLHVFLTNPERGFARELARGRGPPLCPPLSAPGTWPDASPTPSGLTRYLPFAAITAFYGRGHRSCRPPTPAGSGPA